MAKAVDITGTQSGLGGLMNTAPGRFGSASPPREPPASLPSRHGAKLRDPCGAGPEEVREPRRGTALCRCGAQPGELGCLGALNLRLCASWNCCSVPRASFPGEKGTRLCRRHNDFSAAPCVQASQETSSQTRLCLVSLMKTSEMERFCSWRGICTCG